MVLRAGYLHLAVKLQEASGDAMHSDVRARLADAINDAHRGTGHYGNYIDHSGDGESGDVVYSCDGDIRSAPYEMSSANGKAVTTVDTENSKNVVPMTTYQEEADDDDHYASMEESFKKQGLYTALPLYERFIPKSERDAADEGDFAGKGKSYPILKPGDVQAAVHAMGRAGDKNVGMSTLKSRIIAIAKRKGWASYLPKSWQGGATDTSEADVPRGTSKLALVESVGCEFLSAIKLSEAARTNYPIKVISPGTGSSAHYSESVVKNAAHLVKPGTLMFWNHPTKAEESARPEGDLNNLAAIITTQGKWDANGSKGPGIYAEAKAMADYAQKVEERAPHIGLSIRAGGTGTGKTVNGVPELASIDHIESVDYVTKAGRGGLALAEAARTAGILDQEVDMTETEVNRLIEAARVKWNAENDGGALKKLQERALKGDATVSAGRLLAPLALNEAQKQFIVENVLREALPIKDGALDEKAFEGLVTTEAKRVAALLGVGLGEVRGMGTAGPGAEDDDDDAITKKRLKEAKRQRKLAEADHEDEVAIFESLGMPKDAATFAAKGRAA